MAFLPPVLGYLVEKGLQRGGGHGHPRNPPGYVLGIQLCAFLDTFVELPMLCFHSMQGNSSILGMLAHSGKASSALTLLSEIEF